MRRSRILLAVAIAAGLLGCSDSPSSDSRTAAARAAQPVTGQSGLFKMYQTARLWNGDVQILKMNSIVLSEVSSSPGKAGAWEATFVSPSKFMLRSWTYSVVESAGNLHVGSFAGLPASWPGPSPDTPPFLISSVKTDSDAAYKTAKSMAGPSLKGNEGKPISFLLESNRKYADPVWRVIWGSSPSASSLSIFVDATTGDYLDTLH